MSVATTQPNGIASSFGTFFLFGCPRSGTTLLQAILNRHPEIVVPPESKVFCYFHSQPARTRLSCLRRIESDWGVQIPSNLVEPGISPRAVLEYAQRAFVANVKREDATLIGEKTPEHTAHIPVIRRYFPESRLVAIVRNGVHVADSLSRVPWLKCDHGAAAAVWSFYMEHISRAYQSQSKNMYIVRYEDLVSSPALVLRGLLDFLEVEPGHEEHCITPNADLDGYVFPIREVWKQKSVCSIQAASCCDLTKRQLARILAASGEMLRQWDYLPKQPCVQPTFWDKCHNNVSLLRMLCHLPKSMVLSEAYRRLEVFKSSAN